MPVLTEVPMLTKVPVLTEVSVPVLTEVSVSVPFTFIESNIPKSFYLPGI
ncbi:MAG: hypothetical protein ACM3PT_12325 [Deltaproteobacteria bacterium]